MSLGGLYLKTCLLNFLKLSRQVVLLLIAPVDSLITMPPSNCFNSWSLYQQKDCENQLYFNISWCMQGFLLIPLATG